MKKVAFVIPQIGKGGAERVVVNLANQLVERGHEVSIYTILSQQVQYPLDVRVKHIYLGEVSSNKLLRVFERMRRLTKLLKEADLDTIIAFDRTYGMSCGLKSGKRIIASERNDPYSNMGKYSFEKRFRDRVYKQADMVVFQTEYAKAYFSPKIQAHSCIIPNPVSSAVLPMPFEGLREKTVVTACRLTEQKNIPMMLRAFCKFHKTYPEYSLHLYGDGHLLDAMTALAEQLGIGECVVFHGYTEGLPEKIHKAGMYISSSDYEGISNSMLEALAMGIPTICTDCPAGGAQMSIQNGENGILVPVGDADALCDAMVRVASDPLFATSIGREAVKIRERFSIGRITEMWEAIL